tara:strand:- start:2150 stop:2431 length:282 start_codon:yes stop_codon:yes gene_type:complete
MDIVVGNIFNDIINFKNKKINISIMCQRIFYYIQEYLKPTKYSEEDILKISCHVADIIEYNLNKLENENKLLYMNTKEIFKLINDLIYQSKIV